MKLKKIRNILAIIAYGFLAIGVALYIVVPKVFGNAISYDPFKSFLTGAKSLVNFGANSLTNVLMASFAAAMLTFIVCFGVVGIAKKKYSRIATSLVALIGVGIATIIMSLYVSCPIYVNGGKAKLFSFIYNVERLSWANLLLALALVSLLVSMLFMVLYLFMDASVLLVSHRLIKEKPVEYIEVVEKEVIDVNHEPEDTLIVEFAEEEENDDYGDEIIEEVIVDEQ